MTPLAEGRPVVYCARGSHASYWTSDPPKRLPFGLGTDRADGRGHVIDSARNLIVVHQDPATGRCPPGQEWVRFTGRWGQTFDDGLPLIASSPPGPCVRREAHRVSPGGPGAPPSTTLDDAALHYRPTTCAPSASVSTGYAIT